MKYLSVEEVLFLYDQIIQKTGGKQGIRSPELLFSAIERPKATFAGKDLYPDIYSKASALVHSIILNHPFVDGNKRTALACLFRFLEINGIKIKSRPEELIILMLKIENKKMSFKKLTIWLKQNSVGII